MVSMLVATAGKRNVRPDVVPLLQNFFFPEKGFAQHIQTNESPQGKGNPMIPSLDK